VIIDGFAHALPDIDPSETDEWLDSLDSVIEGRGKTRARYLLLRLLERARAQGVSAPAMVSTDYINTIPPEEEPWFPGDEFVERRIRAFIRWNAAVMVTRANRRFDGIGGHLSTYQSAASLYEVGFNWFFRGKADGGHGDQIFVQGHATPGIYARSFLEGRITEERLDRFRREVEGDGLPSYPHPRRMPEYWEFPTVSMGLGPINSIYQARFHRYLRHREITDTSASRVWCFVGDGEMDEPESRAALSLAGREQLDNLIWVVNCNLQRLDGPVRGNGKIIQELEALFRGAGWNVIKVIWGRGWDPLLARDVDGALVNKMNTDVDGQFQRYRIDSGAYIREHFFGPDPRLRALVEHMTDDDIHALTRGGHDYRKLFAAYTAATQHEGSPTVILAKTIKGWTLGADFESRNATHQLKKMNEAELKTFRDRLHLDIPDEQLETGMPPYYHPGFDSPEYEYMMERRRALSGPLPERVVRSRRTFVLPGTATDADRDAQGEPIATSDPYQALLAGTGDKVQASTTMAFTRLLRGLLRDPQIGRYVVPIIPDEGRTFGMDNLFHEAQIYSPFGQRYEPVDWNMMLSYRESPQGQILEEGITEAGSMASFTAAGTAYSTFGEPMIPFFTFYSMFGFQRIGDAMWSFGDQRGRGFLLGATAGRTTLQGEGLQHDDGHSLLLHTVIPNCQVYDPAFAYEVAVVIRDGMQRMFGPEPEDIFYYLALYNENHAQPGMPEGVADQIVRGMYRLLPATDEGATPRSHRATILASGVGMQAALAGRRLLAEHHDVDAEIWSVPSWKRLRDDALADERWNRLHPDEPARVPYVSQQLADAWSPVVAVTDWLKAVPDSIGRWVPGPYVLLGTDGFGLSDTRPALRRHFETDAEHVAVAVLAGLAQRGDLKGEVVAEAIRRYEIDPEAVDPLTL
jgi:pyruvate dehydrogenase E1 component